MSVSKPDSPAPKDGVYNASKLLVGAGSVLYFAVVPITSYLTQPGGVLEQGLSGAITGMAYVATAGASSSIAANGHIAALTMLNLAMTYVFSAGWSVAGAAAGLEKGRSNNHPRAQDAQLRGLPLRLKSAHLNMVESFPSFAVVAALAQTMAPADPQIRNLLGLHVLTKGVLFWAAYAADLGPARSAVHVVSVAALLNVGWRLALAG